MSLLQHHSSKASILWCSAFFKVQLSHLYMTTGKSIALTRWTFVGKVMSLLFNTLSRFATAFLPRSKCLLISWLHSTSAMILLPKKIKSLTVSIVSPTICHGVMELDAMILVFWVLSFKSVFFFPTLLFYFHQEALQFLYHCTQDLSTCQGVHTFKKHLFNEKMNEMNLVQNTHWVYVYGKKKWRKGRNLSLS